MLRNVRQRTAQAALNTLMHFERPIKVLQNAQRHPAAEVTATTGGANHFTGPREGEPFCCSFMRLHLGHAFIPLRHPDRRALHQTRAR